MDTKLVLNTLTTSSKTLAVTNENFTELETQITNTYTNWANLKNIINIEKRKLTLLTITHYASYTLIVGFFYKKIKEKRNAQQLHLESLTKQYTDTFLYLDFAKREQLEKSWANCKNAFEKLTKCKKIWNLTEAETIDNVKERTIAQTGLKRTEVNYERKDIPFIKSNLDYLFLPNKNSYDIYIYPTFLIFLKENEIFRIFNLKDIKISFLTTQYIEEENVPNDTKVIDHTWRMANKDGTMDKRYTDNKEIPVVTYGQIILKTQFGLKGCFMFSNNEAVSNFASSYDNHTNLL